MELKSLIRNKKGDITDNFVFMIMIFILVVGFFIIIYVITQITGGMRDSGMNSSSEGDNAIDKLENFGTSTIQRGVFFLFAGMIIGTMTSAFFIRVHPIFMFLYILFLILEIFIGTFLGNAYESFSTNPIFASTLASQNLLGIIMNNYIVIITATAIISMIIVFAKFNTRGNKIPL